MSLFAAALTGAAIVVLVAAPGEPSIAEGDVPAAARMAVFRRLDNNFLPIFRRLVVKPSGQLPGYVVCGEVSGRQTADTGEFERFFVVIPGSFAVLDRDGSELIDKYWKLNGC
jgi:hypothetical protein